MDLFKMTLLHDVSFPTGKAMDFVELAGVENNSTGGLTYT
jgi:hypothetical protein